MDIKLSSQNLYESAAFKVFVAVKKFFDAGEVFPFQLQRIYFKGRILAAGDDAIWQNCSGFARGGVVNRSTVENFQNLALPIGPNSGPGV